MWWNHKNNQSLCAAVIWPNLQVQSIEQYAKKIKAITSNNQIHMNAFIFKILEHLYLLPNAAWALSDFQNVCVQVSCPGTSILIHRFQRFILPLYLHLSTQFSRTQDWLSLSKEDYAPSAPIRRANSCWGQENGCKSWGQPILYPWNRVMAPRKHRRIERRGTQWPTHLQVTLLNLIIWRTGPEVPAKDDTCPWHIYLLQVLLPLFPKLQGEELYRDLLFGFLPTV